MRTHVHRHGSRIASKRAGLMLAASTLAVMISGAGASAAFAQAANPAPKAPGTADNVISEVVVTAEFRAASVQNTPIAITAVNAAMLEQRSQTSIEQVANQAPNVTLKPQGAAFGPSLGASIRGVGQFDFNPALEPGVGLYVDDVYYPTLTGSILDLLDLDRVEILRGPQGTLAGKNSLGGAVKLFSKAPSADEGGYLEATYGSLNRIDARGSADFAIVPDQLFARIAAVTKHRDGYVDRIDYACSHPGSGLPSVTNRTNCKIGEEGGKSYSALRASIRWVPTTRVEVNLIADYTNDDSENPATTLVHTAPLGAAGAALTTVNGVSYGPQFIPANRFQSYATFMMPAGTVGPFHADALSAEDRSRYKGGGVSGAIDWKIADNLSLRSISAYRQYTSDFAEDNDVSPLPLGLGIEHLKHNQVSEEVRLNGDVPKLLDYTVGAFFFHEKTIYATHQDLWYPGIILNFLGNDPVTANTRAGFAHAVWHVTDRLNLTGGIRYTHEDKDYHYVRVNPDGTFNPVVGPLNGQVGHYEGSRWDYRANVDYHWTDQLMTYAQFSTGFKGGGVNPRPFVVAQVRPFGPETLDAYEVGFKASLLDRRMRLNGSAFYNDYSGIQLTLQACPQYGGPGPCALPQNAGNAHVKGLEGELELHPVAGLEIDAAASYIDFKYTSINPQAGAVTLAMTTPYNPKYKWSVGAQYDFDLGGLGSLTPRIDATYQGGIYTNAVNAANNRIPGYTLVNARATYRPRDSKWEASVEVTNLTDKFYYVTLFDLTGAGGGAVGGQPAPQRQWAVTVKRRF